MNEPTLVAIDDDPAILQIVARLASRFGFTAVTRTDARAALAELATLKPDLVLVDLMMPEVNGLEVLRAVREADPAAHVVLMTGHASVETAIEAVKLGALDYVTKPFDLERLAGLFTTVRAGLERRARILEVDADVARQFEFCGMIGRSAEMQELFDTLRRLAPHIKTVLVTGETGTGKELVARALHKLGPRRDRKFLTVNCSAVVESLFESELFGHQRGAFTGATENKVGLFEHADGGTLFLDEIGELPLAIQAKLLRAIEYGEVQRVGALDTRRVDVTVIAATNRDLRAEAAANRFRSDLFYRLGVIDVHIPPLRERRDDIPYLTAAFVQQVSARLKRPLNGVTSGAERILQHASWPGNVRELRNVIERAALLSDGKMLTDRDVTAALPDAAQSRQTSFAAAEPIAATTEADPNLLTSAQRTQIARVLRESNGNKTAAARSLGISRRSLYRWLDRLDLNA
jgi:DNA-binding NtrC family response regulator